jgi:electron transfer flavoprotein alpha subunit
MTGRNAAIFAQQLDGCPLQSVYVYDEPEVWDFRADSYACTLEDCIKNLMPSIVLIGSTPQGKSVAPIAATKFHTGLTADCTALEIRNNSDLVQIRPAFGGNIMAQIITASSRPQFATVRYNVMPAAERNFENKPEIVIRPLPVQAKFSRLTVLSTQTVFADKDIADEDVLVVAGRGIKSRSDISMMEELATLLGGQLASTRALVEKGWMPQDNQIGLSGKAVKPKLLITCGVSGSVQFMAGMREAKTIIAVNNDPKSRIFSIAHYPVCGDLYEIVPALIKKLKTETKI